MKSFNRHALKSNSTSRNKRLALTLLVSFCLAYMGQAFAMPMVCMMPADSNAPSVTTSLASDSSPCHQVMPASVEDELPTMTCCDQSPSNDAGQMLSSHDCVCPDGGCSISLIFFASLSCSSLSISEQSHYYSKFGFPSQIDSALFRPPIA